MCSGRAATGGRPIATLSPVLVAEVAAVLAGAALVLWTLASAIRTIVVPRALPVALTRVHFRALRRVFDVIARPARSYETFDRVLALYAPFALVLLPGVWVTLVLVGFAAIFWGSGVQPLYEAFRLSGSSLYTLGFDLPSGYGRVIVSFVEAGLGLAVLSLMISYLPTIYGAFRTREALVSMLEVRSGIPPTPARLLARYARIGWLDQVQGDLFDPWERWFVDVEESHTSQASLAFFRSPTPYRNWVNAAGCVLDAASIYRSAVVSAVSTRPDLMIRTGFLCLRRIADFYGVPYDADPAPTDPISVTRQEFDETCDELEAAGVPLVPDREQAWRDFAGWRVNYDTVLRSLAALVDAPPAPWIGDGPRGHRHRSPVISRRKPGGAPEPPHASLTTRN